MPGDDSCESAPFLYHVSPRENHWGSCDRKERDESVHQEPLPLSPVSYTHGARASLSGIPLHLLAASPPLPGHGRGGHGLRMWRILVSHRTAEGVLW